MDNQVQKPEYDRLMLTLTSEYALRAVVHLAQVGGGPVTAPFIAERTKVPAGYLQKILRTLSRAGILDSQRGVGGGFLLARKPSEITVLDVLSASDDSIPRIRKCPLDIPDHVRLCALHRLLDEQLANLERVFAATSIADILNEEDGIRPLCQKLTTNLT